jgi:hypothetical protein
MQTGMFTKPYSVKASAYQKDMSDTLCAVILPLNNNAMNFTDAEEHDGYEFIGRDIGRLRC